MSMKTLERAILEEARRMTQNPSLKMADILEWSSGDLTAKKGEIAIRLPNIGCTICIGKGKDKRKRTEQ
jgi:hypothetical protein